MWSYTHCEHTNINTCLSVYTHWLSTPRIHSYNAFSLHSYISFSLLVFGNSFLQCIFTTFLHFFFTCSFWQFSILCALFKALPPPIQPTFSPCSQWEDQEKKVVFHPDNTWSTASLLQNTTEPIAETRKSRPEHLSSCLQLFWAQETSAEKREKNLRSSRVVSTNLPTFRMWNL